MNKKLISIFLMVAMIISCLPFAVSADKTMEIKADTVEVPVGTNEVSVAISIANNPGIATIGFQVAYDSQYLTFKEWTTSGKIFSASETDTNTAKNPFLLSSYTGSANKTANGEYVTLTFELKPNCPIGKYDIELSEYILGGAYNIDEQEVAYKLVSGAVVVKTNSTPTGTLGDVNDDGEVDELDSAIVARYSAGLADLTSKQQAVADVNNDSEVDELDSALISRYSAGLISHF